MVCLYAPAGNVIGAPVYEEGKPCDKCGDKKCKDGLCTDEGDGVTDTTTSSPDENTGTVSLTCSSEPKVVLSFYIVCVI